MPLRLRFEDGRPVPYDACPNCGTARVPVDTSDESDARECPVCDLPDVDVDDT